MVMFLSLPDDVIRDLLCDWLPVNEVVRVDSSLCNFKKRKHFSELLNGLPLDPNKLIVKKENLWNDIWKWLSMRKVFVSSVILRSCDFDNFGFLNFEIATLNVQRLSVTRPNVVKANVAGAINCCHYLTSLSLVECTPLLGIRGFILTKLNCLEIKAPTSTKEVLVECLTVVEKQCVQLREFTCVTYYNIQLALCNVLKVNCDTLEVLKVYRVDEEMLAIITQCCKSLESIAIFKHSPSDWLLVRECKLKRFDFDKIQYDCGRCTLEVDGLADGYSNDIIEHCNCSALKSISMTEVSEEYLSLISQSSSMVDLYIDNCSVNYEHLKQIFECRELKILHCINIPSIQSNNEIVTAIQNMKKLVELSLGSPDLEVDFVKRIIQNCNMINDLTFHFDDRWGNRDIEEFQRFIDTTAIIRPIERVRLCVSFETDIIELLYEKGKHSVYRN